MARELTGGERKLLKHFDDELAKLLASWLSEDRLTEAHIAEIVRLTAADPRYRDLDAFESLLEDAEEMDAEGFKKWITHTLEQGEG